MCLYYIYVSIEHRRIITLGFIGLDFTYLKAPKFLGLDSGRFKKVTGEICLGCKWEKTSMLHNLFFNYYF